MKGTKLVKLILSTFLLMTLSSVSIWAKKLKVVYHVSDQAKVQFALGNMRNHIKGVGGPENVELVLVVHGAAMKGFDDFESTNKVKKLFAGLKKDGVEFNACGNTMRKLKYNLKDLVPGFIRVDQGGVVKIAELQSEGYLYIRP
jgi:intracellular sulfur oxidation DsrE/DsrF family protein|tara:strand:- start:139 stop:570 length:432 start_codon:yes stop_codon:yes gene_type:complete